MIIEERIAYGNVVVRVITRKDPSAFLTLITALKIRYTKLMAFGPDGEENVIFSVLRRDLLESFLEQLKASIPTAFYTVEGVKAARESGTLPEPGGRLPFVTRLRAVIRQ